MKEFTGVCVPVGTTFDGTGEVVDEKAYLKHIDKMIEAGVHIILACGETGEFACLRSEERSA